MDELVESIRTNGILTPVLIRPDDENGYEMISGHRRMHAAKLVGLATLPAIIKEMTDDEATLALVDWRRGGFFWYSDKKIYSFARVNSRVT